MRGLARLLAISAALLAQPGSANVLTYQCQGYSELPAGDRVSATQTISQDGTSLGWQATWGPRADVANSLKQGIAVDLELSVIHPQPAQAGIDETDGGFLTVMALAPPGTRQSSDALRRDLSKLRIDVSIDGNLPVEVAFDEGDAALELPMTASRIGRIGLPVSSRLVVFTVRDGKGRTLNTTRFDLTQTAGRDAQYQIARKAADKAALDYKTCQRVG